MSFLSKQKMLLSFGLLWVSLSLQSGEHCSKPVPVDLPAPFEMPSLIQEESAEILVETSPFYILSNI